jgi:hemerythrin-like domain-containing protein
MQATEILMNEHRVIERVLGCLETAAQRLKAGKDVDASFFTDAADFIKGFADGCHHHKEEDVLFKVMVTHGLSEESGPIAVMLEEHEEARRFTRAMRAGAERLATGDRTAIEDVASNALDYVALLRRHIEKEDKVLFPLADQVVPQGEVARLTADFDRIENEEDRQGLHDKYLGLADDLEKRIK